MAVATLSGWFYGANLQVSLACTQCTATTDYWDKGAGLVSTYLYANGEDPIISGAIAMSGSVDSRPAQEISDKFSKLAGAVDCGGLSAEEELSCMQEVPALRLQDLVQSSTLPGSNTSTPKFGAAIDGITAFANNTERLEKNLTANIVSKHA